jgi:hypothetical protein
VATEEIVMCDKEMQFADGDMTRFSNILAAIAERRAMRKRGEKPTDSLFEAADKIGIQRTSRHGKQGKSVIASDVIPPSTSISSAAGAVDGGKLTVFLRRASTLCESIITESRLKETQGGDRGSESKGLFTAAVVAVLGVKGESREQDNRGAEKELSDTLVEELRSRPIIALRFSPLQPHVLVTVHGLSAQHLDDGNDRGGQPTNSKSESKSSDKSKRKSNQDVDDAPTSLYPKRPLASKVSIINPCLPSSGPNFSIMYLNYLSYMS